MTSSNTSVSDDIRLEAKNSLMIEENEKQVSKNEIIKKRETWKNKTESFLSVLGYVIGLGNIWRFPYVTYANGGGAFLIPYLIFMVLLGFPVTFMETSLGQCSRVGAIEIWNKVPIMKGIGIGCCIVNLHCSFYYIVIMAWGILYFVHCFTTDRLPWTSCDNWWNSENCFSYHDYLYNQSNNLSIAILKQRSNRTVLSSVEFWNYYAIRKSSGIHEMGTLENWPLLLCLIAAWVIIYFCIFKGVKSTGKVVYFTATFPYVILAILLVQGCLLDGAREGIIYYLKPNLTKLQEPQVWVQAGSQVCYTLGICFTVLVAFGSYNDYHMDCYKHSIMVTVSCCLTSFIAGLSVFAILGHLAFVLKKDVADVVDSGPGLVFLTYPIGLSLLGVPQLWSALFFFLIIIIGIDTQFSGVEGLLTIIYDNWKIAKNHKELFSGIQCFTLMIIGMVFVMNGGIYVFELFNNYAANGITLLWLVMSQSIAIGWLYGIDRFYDDIKDMIGYYPSRYIKICICYTTPLLTLAVLIYYLVNFTPLTLGSYKYPPWANGVGWLLCLSSFLCVPVYAGSYLVRTKGTFKKRLQLGITENKQSGSEQYNKCSKDSEIKVTIDNYTTAL